MTHLLADQWRREAASYERDGQPGAAILRRVADELDAWIEKHDGELLDLTTASGVSGYSTDQLRRFLDAHRLTDYGRPGSPKVRRGDLPKRLPPAPKKPRTPEGLPDLASEVLDQSP